MVFFTLSINETDLRVGLSMWRLDINSSHVTFFNSPVTPGGPGFLYREGSVVIKSPISYSLCGFSVYFPVPVRGFSFSRVRSFRPSCLLSSPHIASALTGWGLKMVRLLSAQPWLTSSYPRLSWSECPRAPCSLDWSDPQCHPGTGICYLRPH